VRGGFGKDPFEEITKTDLEAFIEREQDRGLMISMIRTKLNYIQAFLRYGIETEVVSSDVLARRTYIGSPFFIYGQISQFIYYTDLHSCPGYD